MKLLSAVLFGFLVIFTAVAPVGAENKTITGKVVGISDGDTITVLDGNNQQTRIRLAEIDAPESSQPYGKRSKQVLSDLIFGKEVYVEVQNIDRYGRSDPAPIKESSYSYGNAIHNWLYFIGGMKHVKENIFPGSDHFQAA